jgi:PST family polysaccharide transporter
MQANVSDRRLALGAAVMTGANIVKIGIQFVMIPIMARLLGPGSYGLYALALPTITFMVLVADGGLGNSLARETPEARAVWSSAFWAVHALGLVLACVVIVWSFLLARITNQPELPKLMAALSIALLFVASSVLPIARMLRQERLYVGATADLVGTILGAALGATLAFRGAGTWSLVAQYLATFAIRTVIMNVVSFELPALTCDLRLLRPHLMLGGSMVGSRLVDYAGRAVENTLISSKLGASTLGAFGFANQIPRFLCESASNAVWLVLYLHATQRPLESVLRSYYEFSRALGILLFPFTILSAVASSKIIDLFLGPAWHTAALPLSILLATSTFPTIGGLNSAMIYGKGHGGLQLGISCGFIIARVCAVVGAWSFGLVGVAAAVGAVNVAYGIIAVIVPSRVIGTSPLSLLRALLAPFCCSIAAGAAYLVLLHVGGTETLTFILAGLASLILYLGLLWMLERQRLIGDLVLLRALIRPARPRSVVSCEGSART